MPFKSEKQRRFLWAEHPDIAKRWAHEYPNQKKLPMYAHEKKTENTPSSDSKEKAANLTNALDTQQYVNKRLEYLLTPFIKRLKEMNKSADSRQEIVDVPHSSKPTYANEEREKGEIKSEIPDGKNVNESCGHKPTNAINDLLTKLSVVLSPHIEQTIENMNAEAEGRVPKRVAKNRNLKKYPFAALNIPLPLGMQQPHAQQTAQNQQNNQQNNQYPARPVGGGSNPQFNPINAFGAISMSGVINGNAAFGAKNSPDSSKIAEVIKRANRSETLGKIMSMDASDEDMAYWEEEFADELAGYQKAAKDNKTTPCSCGCGDTITTCKCPKSCSCKQPGGSCYKPTKEKDADMVKYSLDDMLKSARCWAGYEPVPGKKPYSEGSCRPAGSGKKKKKEEKSESEKSSALGLWDRIRAKRERGEKPAKRGDKDYPDAKSWKKVTGISEKEAGTPAWQRSEGKNEEGGLNAKGRASYNKATGGHLKAPVTESNPKGDRAKRQNSFCARMCGMKKHETGSKTKSDPDSRINKSLRKWNCKCSSAIEFGGALAEKLAEEPTFFQSYGDVLNRWYNPASTQQITERGEQNLRRVGQAGMGLAGVAGAMAAPPLAAASPLTGAALSGAQGLVAGAGAGLLGRAALPVQQPEPQQQKPPQQSQQPAAPQATRSALAGAPATPATSASKPPVAVKPFLGRRSPLVTGINAGRPR